MIGDPTQSYMRSAPNTYDLTVVGRVVTSGHWTVWDSGLVAETGEWSTQEYARNGCQAAYKSQKVCCVKRIPIPPINRLALEKRLARVTSK